MIVLERVPVDLDPDRLAGQAGTDREEAQAFLETAGPYLRPTGCFDEVDPAGFLGEAASSDWTGPAIIGLVSLGPEAAGAAQPGSGNEALARALLTLALREALDYVEYRVRQYLKPTGRVPGPRMVPGCPDLPLEVNRMVLNHFRDVPGLGPGPLDPGRLDPAVSLAFLYPTEVRTKAATSKCDLCQRKDCPARAFHEDI
ncbi:MAG: hypothetical protein AB1896_13215 [Thermodesulfobacteriota bacterium]